MLSRYRLLAEDMLGRQAKTPPVDIALREAVAWLYRAQDASPDRGVSHSYHLKNDWAPSYPETTGYIIPTLLNWAQLTGDQEARQRALQMADWESEIQLPAGGVMGSVVRPTPGKAVVFNTGQVVFGWLAAYRETADDKYLASATRAGVWLFDTLGSGDTWRSHGSMGEDRTHTYNVRVAWALLELDLATDDGTYRAPMERVLRCVLTQEQGDGWFEKNCLTRNDQPLLHTIAYTARGLLECGRLLEEDRCIDAVRRTADALVGKIADNGYLAGRFDDQWQARTKWSCLTGMAQLSIVLQKLHALDANDTYREAAGRLNNFLRARQRCQSKDRGVRGGIAGSHPINGEYGNYRMLNWAAKFFIDALLYECIPRCAIPPNSTQDRELGDAMRILAITYCYAPLRFPATFRLLKWCKYLEEDGHQVTVVSVDPGSFNGPQDPSLARIVPAGVTNITVASRENTLPYRVLGKRKNWFYRVFQPHKREWLGPTRRKLAALNSDDYDLIFSCSQPPVCHLLGGWLKQRTGLPWVAYFSDPWVDNPYGGAVPARIRSYNSQLEAAAMTTADKVVFSSPETRDMVLARYSSTVADKAETLDHGFVPEWFQLADAPLDNGPNATAKVVSIGNFYGPRSAIPLLEQLAQVDRLRDLVGRLRLEFYGTMSQDDLGHSIWESVGELARFRGPVDYLTGLAVMRHADCLLLIDAPAQSETKSVFFPSKLAEYLGSGRPIIGLTPREGTTARILRELGQVVIPWDKGHRVGDLVSQAACEPSWNGNQERRSQYDYRRVGSRLVEIMRSAIAGAGLQERCE